MRVQFGDILFYYGDKRIGSRTVSWLQRIFKQQSTAREDYTHVAMVTNVADILIEMKFPEPRFREIEGVYKHFHVYRPKCDEITKLRAYRWLLLHTGANYRMIHYITGYFGWRSATKICSGWLNKGFKESQYPLVENDKLISPRELSVSSKLEFVG